MVGISCPTCTFLNHPSMLRCELCDSPLPITSNRPQHRETIKTDFAQNEQARFLESLHESLQDQGGIPPSGIRRTANPYGKSISFTNQPVEVNRSPSASIVGISGILRNIDDTQSRQSETMVTAFSDLQALMAQAADMVQLAEALNAKLQAQKASADPAFPSPDDVTVIQMSLVNLGLDAPAVTKDLAGAKYHAELAQELADFLTKSNIFEPRQGHGASSLEAFHEQDTATHTNCISLTDIYCMYNRARGIALISPLDLIKACELLPKLNLPYNLRTFNSGLLAIEYIGQELDDNLISMVNVIKQRKSATAAELSRQLGQQSIGLIIERLELAESKGLLCRDRDVQGDRFYDNLFASYEWDGTMCIKAM